MTTLPIDSDGNNAYKLNNAFIEERNALRKFLAGLTATTFGVLTALHPQNITAVWTGWLYVGAVLSNACSAIFLLFSLFERCMELKQKTDNACKRNRSVCFGKGYEPIRGSFHRRFSFCVKIGVVCYILAILMMCAYVVSEMIVVK